MPKYNCKCSMCGDVWTTSNAGKPCPNCYSDKITEIKTKKVE